MGAPVPLTANINGQKLTVGKAFFDSASGEVKAMLDKNCPSTVRNALKGRDWEISLAPVVQVGAAFDRLLTTTKTKTTTIEEG